MWGENMDILLAARGGGSATGHGDYSLANKKGQVLIFGGSTKFGEYCGFTCSASHDVWSVVYSDIGARLAYYGVVDIV